jgi:hypothetical protein
MKSFSRIAGKISKYFAGGSKVTPQIIRKRSPSVDIEDQSESQDDSQSTETDSFYSQDDSQPHFEYYRTHEDFIKATTGRAAVDARAATAAAALQEQSAASAAADRLMPIIPSLPPSPKKRTVSWEVAPVSMVPLAPSANSVDFQNSKFVMAKADWKAVEAGDLELVKNQYYEAAHCFEDGWWLGRNSDGVVGVFPSNFVEVIETSWF